MDELSRHLKIFFLEDNPDDVELELHELQRSGIDVEYQVARNHSEFVEQIVEFSPDIILADYTLPDITGIEAINICKDLQIDVPVILITGDGNELIAVDSLRLGAIDYILKKNITGLPMRIKRALEIWEDRKAKQRAEAEEQRLEALLLETQKMEAVGRFAGGIAHDFNNLLTGILGFAELGSTTVTKNSEVYNKLQSIIMLSKRGSDLVQQLLMFSRKKPLKFEHININTFVEETREFLKRLIEDSIDIHLELHNDMLEIECDKQQLMQAVMNLVLNARDAMSGKGTITITTGKYDFHNNMVARKTGKRKSQFVSLSVSDTGVGISPDKIGNIFEPFYTTKGKDKGTGLGLSIVYSIVNSHGGFIDVNSKENQGSTFRLYLPAIRSRRKSDAGKFDNMALGPSGSTGTAREIILVAEDDDILRGMVGSVLRAVGFNVLPAPDGEKALELYKSNHHVIDLVVSDMCMPKKTGAELFTDLKAINPDLKFILTTGYGLESQDKNILESMDAILKKPFTPTKFVQLINSVLNN
jgi:signal transduction histidine kinase